ncbi:MULTISPECIES: 3'-5' exonuclease [unclassified Carboxylicivirga]|uniref:3'-5' exonuclease n=1 Tax=Carboxylicivirga TaxID=1628153 RepID=UPI003D3447F5
MLNHVKAEDVLFLDIETVPQLPAFDQVSPELQLLWEKKSAYFRQDDQTAADVYGRAGIYAEFGKIVCISVGLITTTGGRRLFRVKSFAGDNETVLLSDFADMLKKFARDVNKNICGHNAKEFDIPYIARRMLINGLKLPPILDVAGKKPWEVKFIDTLELWKFGDYKHYTSLNLLTTIFNIPSPKDDIDGSQVAAVYYEEHDVERIARYCEKDVLATAQLFLRFKGEDLIDEEAVEHA